MSALTNDAAEEKWLSVDLGREEMINGVRLVPVEPTGFETLGEKSHPRAWSVELAKDSRFFEVVWRYQMPSSNLVGYPGRCSLVVPVGGKHGRHLRLMSQDLWGTGSSYGFGLAEIEAYAGGRNLALAKPVRANDAVDKPEGSGWSPDFAVDGFSSRGRLIEWPEYLDLVGQRGMLERESKQLLGRKERTVRTAGLVLGYGGRDVEVDVGHGLADRAREHEFAGAGDPDASVGHAASRGPGSFADGGPYRIR